MVRDLAIQASGVNGARFETAAIQMISQNWGTQVGGVLPVFV